MNSFEMLMDLAKRRLVQVRYSDDGKLALFKYHRKVFYDGLWGEDPMLLRARGHVYEVSTGRIVANTFDKVFNYGERGAGIGIDPEKRVISIEKVNGFLASVFWYEDDLRVTSTGTFDSPFVEMARRWVVNDHVRWLLTQYHNRDVTLMFEICDPSDPHIIPEIPGAYLLAYRRNEEGSPVIPIYSEFHVPNTLPWKIPKGQVLSYGEAIGLARKSETEGSMIYDSQSSEYICKVKSSKYLGLKMMARSKALFGPAKSKKDLYQKVDEEFYPIVDFIFDNYGHDRFRELPEQEKLELIRSRL